MSKEGFEKEQEDEYDFLNFSADDMALWDQLAADSGRQKAPRAAVLEAAVTLAVKVRLCIPSPRKKFQIQERNARQRSLT